MTSKPTIFLFGEAEKGEFCKPLHCKSLEHLSQSLGNPPQDSKGISYAVQTLMYDRNLIFFRVKEEGFSIPDYMKGLHLLQTQDLGFTLSALCMPGVGDTTILEATAPICTLHKILLIIDEKDLYDYLTSRKH